MSISFLRRLHLWLSVFAAAFLIMLSLTGIIIAVDNLKEESNPYNQNLKNMTLSQLVTNLQAKYDQLYKLDFQKNKIILSAIDANWNEIKGYIDAKGNLLASQGKQSEVVQFCITLHRSLFLHSTGRVIVGLVSLVLFLISLIGLILAVKQQNGFKNIFSPPLVNNNLYDTFHFILGRTTFVFLLVISITGCYLSFYRFFLQQESAQFNPNNIQKVTPLELSKIKYFQGVYLSDIKSVNFALPDDENSFHTLKLQNKDVFLSQNGQVLSQNIFPISEIISKLSFKIHTGDFGIIWNIILIISCLSILFFIFSGLGIFFDHQKIKIKNKYTPQNSNHVILYGSETGSTKFFVNYLHTQLTNLGQKSFLADINSYNSYDSATNLIFVTSTYGDGEAPFNAKNIFKSINANPQKNSINTYVVGFGSKLYKNYCAFAYSLYSFLKGVSWANLSDDVFTVNQKSISDFNKFISYFNSKNNLNIPEFKYSDLGLKLDKFKVISKTKLSHGMFSIQLSSKSNFNSGDYFAIYPQNKERLYSISKINNKINLVVKLVEGGIGSNTLFNLKIGDFIQAKIIKNTNFYYLDTPKTLLISNGTGIAPFLGMASQNKKGDCYLLAGFRFKDELTHDFSDFLEKQLQQGKIAKYQITFSQEQQKMRVTQLIKQYPEFIASIIKNNYAIMICGSINMYYDIENYLKEVSSLHNLDFDSYKNKGLIRLDCY